MQVRSIVGAMSSVNLRGLGPCRVHVFLRIADAPGQDPCTTTTNAAPSPRVRGSILKSESLVGTNEGVSFKEGIDP